MVNFIKNSKYEIILSFLMITYFIYLSYLSILRHRNFHSNYYDLAIMDQTVYNTSKGRFLELTNPEGTNNFKRMAIHNDIILAFLTPFYWIYSDPETLLVIQSLILSVGAIPLYLLTVNLLKSKVAALIVALSYLIYPPMQWSNLYDFHGVVLATSFLLFMIYFSVTKKYLWAFIFFMLSIFSKEQVALSTGIFAMVSFWRGGDKLLTTNPESRLNSGLTRSRFVRSFVRMTSRQKFYLLIFVISVIWFLSSIFVIIPYFRGGDHFALTRYPNDTEEISLTLNRFFSLGTLRYFWLILGPMAFLPLFAPAYLFMILPELMINLLSNHEAMRGIYYHYTAVLTPYLFIGLIYTVKKFEKLALPLSLLVLVASIGFFYNLSPTHFSKDNFVKKISKSKIEPKNIRIWKDALRDEDLIISASQSVAAQFSQRKKIFLFSESYKDSDYVILYIDDIKNDWLDKQIAIDNYNKLVTDENFKQVMKKDKLEIFKKL